MCVRLFTHLFLTIIFSTSLCLKALASDNDSDTNNDEKSWYNVEGYWHHKRCHSLENQKALNEACKDEDKGFRVSPYIGVGFRGVLAEEKHFWDKLNAEIGALLLWNHSPQIYLGIGGGRFFVSNTTLNYDVRARAFLGTYTPLYAGAGMVLGTDKKFPYFILGIGHSVYAEMQMRSSEVQPIAAIFAFGIRTMH